MLRERRTIGGGVKKKLNLGNNKLAFHKPNCQAMLSKEYKNLPKVIHMRREVSAEDKYEAEWKITQNLIHEVLERVTSVPEAKRYSKKFQHSKRGDDGGLLDVL